MTRSTILLAAALFLPNAALASGGTPPDALEEPASTPHPTPTPAPLPPPRRFSRSEANTLVAGFVVLAVPYTFTSLAGAVVIDKAKGKHDPYTGEPRIDVRRRAFGRALLVPVVGPFVALRHGQSATQRWGAAFSGVVQLAGVALVSAAIVSSVRRRRAHRVSMTASLEAGGATVGIAGRF